MLTIKSFSHILFLLFAMLAMVLVSCEGIYHTPRYRPLRPDEYPKLEYRGNAEKLKELEPVVYDMLGAPSKYSPGIVTQCKEDIVSYVATNGPEGLIYNCIDVRLIQEKCTLQILNVLKLKNGKALSNQTNDYAGEQVRRVIYSNLFLQEYAFEVIKEGLRQTRTKKILLILGYFDKAGDSAIKVIH